MANPNITIMQLAALVANGLSTAAVLAGAGNLALNGSLVTAGVGVLDVARRVAIASTGNDSTVVFTITGTNRNGTTITDTVTGVNAGSVNSTRDFKTVTQIANSAATVGSITAGTSGVGSSEWIVDDFRAIAWAIGGGTSGPAGTTYTVEHTFDDPNYTGPSLALQPEQFAVTPRSQVPPHVFPLTSMNNVSGDNQFSYANQPVFAHRLTINSGTGQVIMWSIQAGAPAY